MNDKSCPQVTLAIFAYNQGQYIEEALHAALSQDYPNLKIIVSDDCSQDSTYEIARRVLGEYKGKHRACLRKNHNNYGLTRHINEVMSLVDTELVVLAAGDDVSFDNRVSIIVDNYIASGKPSLLCSKAIKIDKNGVVMNGYAPEIACPDDDDYVIKSLDRVDDNVGLYLGASGAWTQALWKKYGPIKYQNCWEDVVMGFRARLENSFCFIDEPLLKYRVGIGVSFGTADSIKGKIRNRARNAALKRDLAKQRYDDLLVSGRTDLYGKLARIQQQILCHSIRYAMYRSRHALRSQFKRHPALTVRLLLEEVSFYFRAGTRRIMNLFSTR